MWLGSYSLWSPVIVVDDGRVCRPSGLRRLLEKHHLHAHPGRYGLKKQKQYLVYADACCSWCQLLPLLVLVLLLLLLLT